MFQFPGFASSSYVFRTGYPRKGGFPHSDIRGSTIARISPRLFAACHVLHRLLAPRHPPNALISLHIHTTARAQGQITPNANYQTASHSLSFMGYALSLCFIAFSESPSDSTWLENAPTDSSASHHINAQTNTLTLVMRHNTPIHLHHEKEQQPPAITTAHPRTTAHRQGGFSGSRESSPSANHNHPPWRRSDSNRRPPACKAGALPLSYAPSGETRSLNPSR